MNTLKLKKLLEREPLFQRQSSILSRLISWAHMLTEGNLLVRPLQKLFFVPFHLAFSLHSVSRSCFYVLPFPFVDIIGVVQNVSTTLSIRRKSDNESIPKRDVIIADES